MPSVTTVAVVGLSLLALTPLPAFGEALAAAVLPSSRAVQVGTPATVFATLINTGATPVTDCAIVPATALPVDFVYQTTDPATNALIGAPNLPVSISSGAAQTFVLELRPTAAFPPTEVAFQFTCVSAVPAPSVAGLNTLLLSASDTPIPDIVALAATLQNDGLVHLDESTGEGVFAVATVNVGAAGRITATPGLENIELPLEALICQTDAGTGACLAPPAPTVTTDIAAGATPTFAVFVSAAGPLVFDPARARIFVSFTGSPKRGRTSVAVRTARQPKVVDVPITFTDFGVPLIAYRAAAPCDWARPEVDLEVPLSALLKKDEIVRWEVSQCPVCGDGAVNGVSYTVQVVTKSGQLGVSVPGYRQSIIVRLTIHGTGEVELWRTRVHDLGGGEALDGLGPIRRLQVTADAPTAIRDTCIIIQ